MKHLTNIAAALACFAGVATSSALAQSDTLEDEVQTLLATFHTDYGFPGGPRMFAASIDKTFVGALVLSLENEGALNRTDRVTQYLGDAPCFSPCLAAEIPVIQA